MSEATEDPPGWPRFWAAAIVFPALGPAGPVILSALPLAIMGLFTLGPGGAFYGLFLGAWWLPAFYTLFGLPFLVTGILYGLAARFAGRGRLWLAVLAAEIAFAGYFGLAALLPGGVEAVAPAYMPLWDGVRQNPTSLGGILLSAAACWWIVGRGRRARTAAARMRGSERAMALAAIAAGGCAYWLVLHLISGSPEIAAKDCMGSATSDQLVGCPRVIASLDLPAERRALAARRYGRALEEGRRDLSGAVAAYTEAIRLDPTSAAAFAARALVHARLDRDQEVVTDVDEALRLDPDVFGETRHRLFRARGLARLRLGRPDLAVADHTEEARLMPRYADGLLNRSTAHLAAGDARAAIADADAAIATEAFHPRGYIARGRALVRAGEPDEALAAFDEAIRRMPEVSVTAPAYLGRAAILEARGEREAALAAYDRALALAPSDPAAADGRARLRAAPPPR